MKLVENYYLFRIRLLGRKILTQLQIQQQDFLMLIMEMALVVLPEVAEEMVPVVAAEEIIMQEVLEMDQMGQPEERRLELLIKMQVIMFIIM